MHLTSRRKFIGAIFFATGVSSDTIEPTNTKKSYYTSLAEFLASTDDPQDIDSIVYIGPYKYKQLASTNIDFDLKNSANSRLEVLPISDGAYVDLQFGVLRDNISDDTVALQKFFNKAGERVMTSGTAFVSQTLMINKNGKIRGSNDSKISTTADIGILVGLVGHDDTAFFSGSISDFEIEARNGRNDDIHQIGIQLKNVSGAHFENINSNNFKFPIRFETKSGCRVSNVKLTRCSASRGQVNFSGDVSEGGFANEIKLDSCHGFSRPDLGGVAVPDNLRTLIQAKIDFGNHIRIVDCNFEGNNLESFVILGGHTNSLIRPRIEGATKSGNNRDKVIVLAGSQNITLDVNSLYSGNALNQSYLGTGKTIWSRFGSFISSVLTVPTLTLSKDSESHPDGILKILNSEFSSKSKSISVEQECNNLNLFSVNGIGKVSSRAGFLSEHDDSALPPLTMGDYKLYRSDLQLILENIVTGKKLGYGRAKVPNTFESAGVVGAWAMDSSNRLYVYIGDGVSHHNWVRSVRLESNWT